MKRPITHLQLQLASDSSNLLSSPSISRIAQPVFSVLVLIVLFACTINAQPPSEFPEALNVAKVSAPLSSDERTLAMRLAEQALRSNKLFTNRKMYLTEAHIHRNTASEMKNVFERLAVLTYYRYEGDLTIQVFINLTRQRVLAVKQLKKFTPPISVEELNLAKDLAFNHAQLRDILGPNRDRLVVEALTSASESPKDPLFGHRVVYLFFRVGPNYLMRELSITVDLTTEKVIVERIPKKIPM